MTPIAIFDLIFYKFLRFFCLFCGYDFYSPDYRINWRLKCFVVLMWLAIFCGFYTMCFYDTADMLNAAPTVVLPFQGVAKLATYYKNADQNRESLQSLRFMYVSTDDRTTPNYRIMERWSNRFLSMVKMFSGVLIVTVAIFLTYPVFVYIFIGSRVPMLPMFLPFVDETTTPGYCIVTVMHFIWTGQAAFGLLFSDLFFALLIVHIWPMTDMFEMLLGQMDEAVVRCPEIGRSVQVYRCLRNVILMHCEMCTYIGRLSRMYSVVFMNDVYTNSLMLCLILFSLSVQTWFPLYFLFGMFLCKLFILCVLGTIAELATDRILVIIQNTHWYLLPIPLQRHILCMIIRAQNPTVLMVGTSPLNMVLFVKIMKLVYKLVMLLGEFEINI